MVVADTLSHLSEAAAMPRLTQPVRTPDAAPPGAHYSQGVRSGDLIWTAGCVGVTVDGSIVAGFEGQVRQALENVRATLRAAGTDVEHVVKTTCFVTRREAFAALDPVYSEYFPSAPPARSTIVCELVRPEFLFEIEAVARIP
jgi:2-iminobutanoate/2-iminopropanoate deaminase